MVRAMVAVCLLLMITTGCTWAPPPQSLPKDAGGRPAEGGAKPADARARPAEVVAHRGGKPENTLSAFKAALADPAVGTIEMDVQVSKDGELFIIHDSTVDRTTNGKGLVNDLTAAQMRELRTPKGGAEPIPTLDEVLALLAATPGKRAFVEIKNPTPADTPAKVLGALKKHGVASRSVVISFDRVLLDEVKKLDPGQAVGFVSKSFGNLELSYPSEYLVIAYGAVTPDKLAEAQKAGKQVYVWTVNDRPIIETYRKMGVDGIISDEYRLVAETK